MRKLGFVCTLPVLLSLTLRAEDAVRPGRFLIEPPTLICLGFEWDIAGDDNRNASVEMVYRESGQSRWMDALPLLRIGGEKVGRPAEHLDYTVPHGFAGSIIDLKPDTEYEVRLTMKDPDGVVGNAVQVVKAHTRPEPKTPVGGRVLHVYPPDWSGPRQKPAFKGLLQAYQGSGGEDWNAHAGASDWNVVSERKVQAGDTILVHAGLYRADRLNYSDPLNIPFDGTYVLTAKGTPERPIAIRAAGDGEVIFDGNGCHNLFNVMAADYNIFEGLTIRNTDVAFLAGLKDVQGSKGLTIRNCRIEDVGIAVLAQYAGSKDFYIADNVMLGRNDRFRLHGLGLYPLHGTFETYDNTSQLKSYNAVKVYGSGHVICHNAIAYFWDAIDVCTHGTPDKGQEAVAIDFYNNDIYLMNDDFIEADGGVHNIRILRNRGVNAAGSAWSAQPVFGGPAYFIRNVAYHAGTALKFEDAKPAGLIVYHNTFIVENRGIRDTYSNVQFRNNLFLGTDAPELPIAVFPNATSYSTFDYDGYRPNRGQEGQYLWISPQQAASLPPLMSPPRLFPKDFQAFKSLAEFTKATGQEAHGIEVDYDIFENLRSPDPAKPSAVYRPADLDFKLRPGSKAVDAGVRLPNINDDFTGRAPDLGAYELGKPVPVYGPRWWSNGPFYQ